jgi:hypothetical protein
MEALKTKTGVKLTNLRHKREIVRNALVKQQKNLERRSVETAWRKKISTARMPSASAKTTVKVRRVGPARCPLLMEAVSKVIELPPSVYLWEVRTKTEGTAYSMIVTIAGYLDGTQTMKGTKFQKTEIERIEQSISVFFEILRPDFHGLSSPMSFTVELV